MNCYSRESLVAKISNINSTASMKRNPSALHSFACHLGSSRDILCKSLGRPSRNAFFDSKSIYLFIYLYICSKDYAITN